MEIGTLLLKRRKERRLSQSEAAEQIGVSQSTYCAWESDRATPSARHCGPLAALLGFAIEDLMRCVSAVELPPPAASPLVPIAALLASELQDNLVSAQRETITLQKQRIERLETENQQLQQRLVGIATQSSRVTFVITLLINFSGFLLDFISEAIVVC